MNQKFEKTNDNDDDAKQVEILQTTLDHIGAYVFSKDIQGRYTFANQKVRELFDCPLAEIIGHDDSKFFSLEQSNDIKENDAIVMQQGKTISKEELNIIAKTGKARYYLAVKKPLFDSDNTIIGMFGVSTDITEIKRAELKQSIHSEIMSQIVNKAPLATTLTSLALGIEKHSPMAMCSILLMDDSQQHLLLGAAPSLPDFYNDVVHGMQIGDAIGSCATAAFRKERVIVEDISTHPYWAPYAKLASQAGLSSCWSEPILTTEGKLLGTFAIYHKESTSPNESDFKLIEFAAQLATIAIEQHESLQQQQLFHQIYNDSHEAIMILDEKGQITTINAAFSTITGYSLPEVSGQRLEKLGSNKQNADFYDLLWSTVKYEQHWQGEIWSLKKGGELYLQLLNISALFDENDQFINYVGMFTDITQRKQYQETLEFMAHYDVLTKLPNRVLFEDRFNQAVAQSKRSDKRLAVCFVDLDNFKPVNDNFGHKAGDALLIEIAQRFTNAIREQDTVSRQGGDEFAILLGDIGPDEQYENSVERIHHSLAQPFVIDGHSHTITASTGIALYPSDGEDIDTLLRHADKAMYQAKLSGKHRFEFFQHTTKTKVSG